ncbi:Uncharacterised protein [Mycoplasmopsis citelli]|uniref:Transglutaminase-like domain-containing protein n=1 Tax=Mycoplasmopsis citelli TaxID=171281 RepID=A0A449B156_9BACT|nr:transglutaminase-like domain-containing protein [Mycoplasmopsis citelli]VEU74337.1 Uncharacterised protein [Mycoplasmopsis citelli]
MKLSKFFSSKKSKLALVSLSGTIFGLSIILPLVFVYSKNPKSKENRFFPENNNLTNSNIENNNENQEQNNKMLNIDNNVSASNSLEKEFNELENKFKLLISNKEDLPLSDDSLKYINSLENQIKSSKNKVNFSKLTNDVLKTFLANFSTWKNLFLNNNELIVSPEDKQNWIETFKKSSTLLSPKSNDKSIISASEFKNQLKDFYIYKLKQQINLYEQHPYYLQPLERLKKLLYHYENNYNKYVDFQWGIDKNNKFSLEPSKYYSGNFKQILINDEFIINWLKYYQNWNWIFVNNEDKLARIEDKNIKALQADSKFKDNPVLRNYMQRQFNFLPDFYDELWTIDEQNASKINYKQFINHVSETNFSKYKKEQVDIANAINKIQSKYTFLWKGYPEISLKIDNNEYKFVDWSLIKDFNYRKFYKYQKLVDLQNPEFSGSYEPFNIYNNLIFNEPNLFSDAVYRNYWEDLVNVKHSRFNDAPSKFGNYTIDISEPLTEEEASNLGVDPWKNPISDYRKWFNHWKEVLPNIISKKWTIKEQIKAIAYYIATNSIYLTSPKNTDFNYNGYGFYNPTQIFTNDPEIQCVGYSMNLAAALTILNIPVRIVSGAYLGDPKSTIVSGYHAWNEVFVDGRWKAIDLTNFDLFEGLVEKTLTYELKDDLDLFLERSSEYMNQFKLNLGSYETTIMFFKNPKEYEYLDLPDNL